MTIQARGQNGTISSLHGMLDTGAGVSVMSVEAWRKLGAPHLKPWTVPIRMANDELIRVLASVMKYE